MSKYISTSGHFMYVLDGSKQAQVIKSSVAQLNKLEFDTLAFIGLSGAVVAPILA